MKYEGSPLTPEPTVTDGTTTLVKDTDYTLSYTGNTSSGNATVTILVQRMLHLEFIYMK